MKTVFALLTLLIPALAEAQGYFPFGDIHWQAPVTSSSALPTSGNAAGDARTDLTTFNIWVWNGSAWVEVTTTGAATSIGTFDGQTGQANGLDLVSSVLYAQSATTSVPGMVNTGSQTFAGVKTFNSSPLVPTLISSDSSTKVADSSFVQAAIQRSMAYVPLSVTGGTLSLNSLGSGAVFNLTTSGGVVGSVAITTGGTGFAVGDVITPNGGNYDCYLSVATVSGSAIASVTVLYGGTGYSNGSFTGENSTLSLPFTYAFSGVLSSNLTFLVTPGTYLTQANQWIFLNNTTGAYTVTVKMSNGSDAPTGTGVVIPQSSSNAYPVLTWTDGQTDIWEASLPIPGQNFSAGTITATALNVGAAGTTTGQITLSSSGSASYSTVVEPAPSPSPNLTFELPATQGTTGYLLTAGTPMTWSSPIPALATPVSIANGGTNATSAANGTVPNASSSTASSWTATPQLGVAGTTTGQLLLGNSGGSSGDYLTLQAGAQTANATLSCPVISSNDTIATLALGETFSGNNSHSGTNTFSNIITSSFSAGTAQNAVKLSGLPYPQPSPSPSASPLPALELEPSTQTESTTWSANGTAIGVNYPSTFSGNLMDLQKNGTSEFEVTSGGGVVSNGTATLNGIVDSGNTIASSGNNHTLDVCNGRTFSSALAHCVIDNSQADTSTSGTSYGGEVIPNYAPTSADSGTKWGLGIIGTWDPTGGTSTGNYYTLGSASTIETSSSNLFNGVAAGLFLNNTLNFADTGSNTGTYTDILVNPTETALNSVTHNLMNLEVGSSSKFKVDNSGNTTIGGTVSINGSVGTSGQVAMSNGSSAPSWQTVQGNSTILKAPTVQKFTSSSGTYTTPTSPSPLYIRVQMIGGGGGGAGSGTASSSSNGSSGNSTTFGTSLLSASGGSGATWGGSAGGTGGSASLGSGPIGIALTGGSGGSAGLTPTANEPYLPGGAGGASAFGGSGSGGATNQAGNNGATNTGGGGGGGGSGDSGNSYSGAGGGSGGFVDAIISSPSSSYSYAVGSGGGGGSAGSNGSAGGSGAAGFIIVTEFYQ